MENLDNKIRELLARQIKVLEDSDIQCSAVPVEVSISKLKHFCFADRKLNDSNLSVIVESLKQYGFLGAIFIEANSYRVLDGWHRAMIWKALGNAKIRTYLVRCTTDQERMLFLKLNTQAATFSLADFGLETLELNPADFGLKPDDIRQEISKKFKKPQEPTRNGYTKFTVSVKNETYDRLKEVKAKTETKVLSQTIDFLIQFYYEKI